MVGEDTYFRRSFDISYWQDLEVRDNHERNDLLVHNCHLHVSILQTVEN